MRTVIDRYDRTWTETEENVWETEGLKWAFPPLPLEANPIKQKAQEANRQRQLLSAFNALRPEGWVDEYPSTPQD